MPCDSYVLRGYDFPSEAPVVPGKSISKATARLDVHANPHSSGYKDQDYFRPGQSVAAGISANREARTWKLSLRRILDLFPIDEYDTERKEKSLVAITDEFYTFDLIEIHVNNPSRNWPWPRISKFFFPFNCRIFSFHFVEFITKKTFPRNRRSRPNSSLEKFLNRLTLRTRAFQQRLYGREKSKES